MRALILCVLMGIGGMASADELSEAHGAFAAKDYPKALHLYSRLADRGNPEAQLRLGEMYWYGEGAPLDRNRGDMLFAKAAAAGNKDAANDLGLSAQRQRKTADIAYWTSGYRGEELTSGKFACPAPVLTDRPGNDQDLTKANASMRAWRECYTGFVANIADAMPAGKRIPDDVAIVMSEAELQQARVHLQKVYDDVLVKIRIETQATAAHLDQWRMDTEKYVAARAIRTADIKLRLDDYERELMRSAGPSARVSAGK